MTKKQQLLVVEDEEPIRVGLVDLFVFHGYEVTGAADGVEGLRLGATGRFDLILLDLMLPGLDGLEVCDRIREQDPDQPIIMLTARTADEDIIEGLRLGADDYVAKPFSVTELVLRVQAVLRRSQRASPYALELGDLVLNLDALSGQCGDHRIQLTRREADLLAYLAEQTARAVSREELLHKVWGYARNAGLETRTVDIHIAKLRRKIEPDPAQPRFLVTVRGAGYRLVLTDDGG
jgi:DNA-binding response OmpR family regulator